MTRATARFGKQTERRKIYSRRVWLLYDLALAVALLVAGPLLLLRRGAHYIATLRGRLTLDLPETRSGGLWIHAVSVGEATVAATLARALPDELPLVVTTVTPTGQERARELLAERATVTYLPFDLGILIRRFLDRVDPHALVLVEGDYWPRTLERATARGTEVAVVNGRVGDRTFRRLLRVSPIARWLLGRIDRFGVQSEEDAERLRALGIPSERVRVTGNLKYERETPPPLADLEAAIDILAADRPVLVAGSTMSAEEEKVADAFERIGGGNRALLVLAPRHPERWDEVADLLGGRGLEIVRRSRLGRLDEESDTETGAAPGSSDVDVLLLDSLGELASVYRGATLVFVGGTLVPSGGHNPLEPAVFGRPIVVGPSLENFREIATAFDRTEAWRRVEDVEGLANAWDDWLREPRLAAAHGERARALVEANRGALEATLELLEPIVAPPAEHPEAETDGRDRAERAGVA